MAKEPKKLAKAGDRAVAKEAGFYRGCRYRVGALVHLKEGDKLGKWMELLPPEAKPPVKEAPKPEEPIALSELQKKSSKGVLS